MTMEFWFLAALIPILSAAVLCYVIVRVIWAGLRGFATLLGFSPPRRLNDQVGPARRIGVTHPGRRICSAADCCRVNPANARYCAQCGRRLSDS